MPGTSKWQHVRDRILSRRSAKPSMDVRITFPGGATLNVFREVTDPAEMERFAEEMRSLVVALTTPRVTHVTIHNHTEIDPAALASWAAPQD